MYIQSKFKDRGIFKVEVGDLWYPPDFELPEGNKEDEQETCECPIKLLAAGGCQCEAGQAELKRERSSSSAGGDA